MSFLILRMLLSLSLNPSLAFSFFSCDRYKNGMSCTLILALRVVSFRLFRSRWFGFALHAFNLFAPYRIRPCICVCSFCFVFVSYWFSTNTHTHTYFGCAFAHTHIETMMGREAHRGSGRKNERTSEANERKQEKITSYINAQDDCYAVCINDIQRLGGKHILAFRSIPLTRMMTSCREALLRSYGDLTFFLLLHLSFTNRMLLFFFLLFSIQ